MVGVFSFNVVPNGYGKSVHNAPLVQIIEPERQRRERRRIILGREVALSMPMNGVGGLLLCRSVRASAAVAPAVAFKVSGRVAMSRTGTTINDHLRQLIIFMALYVSTGFYGFGFFRNPQNEEYSRNEGIRGERPGCAKERRLRRFGTFN